MSDLDPANWLADTRDWLAEFCNDPFPLAAHRIWIGHPMDGESTVAAAEYKRVFRELGATVLEECEQGWTFPRRDRTILAEADSLIVIAAAPGAAAEALDLSRRPEEDACPPPGKRLHVYMPEGHRRGYVYRRLRQLSTHVVEFREGEERSSALCIRVVDGALTAKTDMRHKRKVESKEFNPVIGIVTALQLEFEAVCHALGETAPHLFGMPKVRDYAHGAIDAAGLGAHRVVVVRAGVGNSAGAIAAETMLTDYSTIKHVFMVGIAGGVPRRGKNGADVRLGDVIMSGEHGVVKYDFGKRRPDGFECTSRPRPPSAQWLSRATSHCGSAGLVRGCWEPLDKVVLAMQAGRPSKRTDRPLGDPALGKRIQRRADPSRVPNRPLVHLGAIGSGDSVLKAALARDQLATEYKLVGYEMEGSGVAEGTWQNSVGYFVVRGICDYADEGKNDVWQPYAAAVAAVHAVDLIGSMPPLEDLTGRQERAT